MVGRTWCHEWHAQVRCLSRQPASPNHPLWGGGGDGKTLKVKRSADTGERDAEQTKQQVSITDSQPEKFLDYYLKTIKHKRFAGA